VGRNDAGGGGPDAAVAADGRLGPGDGIAHREGVARRGDRAVRRRAAPSPALRGRARRRPLQRRRDGLLDGRGDGRARARPVGGRAREPYQLRARRPRGHGHDPGDPRDPRTSEPAVGGGRARRGGAHRVDGAGSSAVSRARFGAGGRDRGGEARVTAGRAVLLVAVLAASGAGCLRHRVDATAAARAALTSVAYVRRSFQSSLAGCTDPASSAPTPCVRIDVEYVEATRATVELARAVAGFVAETVLRPAGDGPPAPSVEALRDELYERYQERQRAFPDYHVPWQLERTVTVACNTPRVQGLVAADRSFTGGASGI